MSECRHLPIILACGTFLLAGCSADVTRFDFPVFGLAEEESTNSIPEPSESVYDYAPNDQSREYRSEEPWRAPGTEGQDYREPDYRGYDSSAVEETPEPVGTGEDDRRENPTDYARRRSDDRNRDVSALPGTPSETLAGRRTPSYGDTSELTVGTAAASTVTVGSGDTLYSLSRNHGVSIAALRRANGLVDNDIRVGQKLRIPSGNAPASDALANRGSYDTQPSSDRRPTSTRPPEGDGYRVQPGDSLYGIARRHDVEVEALARVNRISDPTKLKVGQVLRLPGSGADTRTTARPDSERTSNDRYASLDDGDEDRSRNYYTTNAAETDEPANRWDSSDSFDGDDRRSRGGRLSDDDRADGLRDDDGDAVVARLPGSAADDGDIDAGGEFRWPAKGRIIAGFGTRSDGTHNDGVNIAVPLGASVKAAEDGVVAYAGDELKGYGRLVLVRHNGNWVSAYAHNEELLVKRGDKVRRGQVIAKAGRSGSVDRPQVHFELRKGSKPVDPLQYMARR